jgi:transcriptional regulator with XRE-family HTH domain
VSTTSTRWEQIARSLSDKDYRDLFAIEEINTGLPFQIRAMREARGWSQKDLADRAGMTQEGVSRLENPDDGKLTLTTLKRLASAFDVGLAVRFVPFSHLINEAVNCGPEDLAVPDYEHDAAAMSALRDAPVERKNGDAGT